jgi:hypothetical protein
MAGIPTHVSEDIATCLDRIGRHFKEPKITLVVRYPGNDDADLIMTNDTPDQVKAALDRAFKPERKGRDV